MTRADALRAELSVVALEEKLVEAKGKNTPAAKLRELKESLRAARQEFREQREAESAAAGTARPATIRATAQARGK